MADGKKSSAAAAASNKQAPAAKSAQQAQNPPKAAEKSEKFQSSEGDSVQIPLTGKVKWFNSVRGFGFITPDDGSADLFVHQTSIYADGFRSLRDGELVEYEIDYGDDGRLRANKVTGPKGAFVEGAREDEGGSPAPYNGGGSERGGFGRGRGRMGRGAGGGVGYGGGRCFNCSQPGHLARDCNMARPGCYSCGKQGHFARDCPNQS